MKDREIKERFGKAIGYLTEAVARLDVRVKALEGAPEREGKKVLVEVLEDGSFHVPELGQVRIYQATGPNEMVAVPAENADHPERIWRLKVEYGIGHPRYQRYVPFEEGDSK